MTPIEKLVGRTLRAVDRDGDDRLTFVTVEGDKLEMYHSPDCCETVQIESLTGDLEDLIGTPILVAEEREGPRPADAPVPGYIDSETWTFYTFRTIKGTVDIRWLGESNGYYSETVDTAWTPAP